MLSLVPVHRQGADILPPSCANPRVPRDLERVIMNWAMAGKADEHVPRPLTSEHECAPSAPLRRACRGLRHVCTVYNEYARESLPRGASGAAAAVVERLNTCPVEHVPPAPPPCVQAQA